MNSHAIEATGTFRFTRLIMEACGSFLEESRGKGVLSVTTRTFWSLKNEGGVSMEKLPPGNIEDSIFVGNRAALGGAITVTDDSRVNVLRCLFQARRL